MFQSSLSSLYTTAGEDYVPFDHLEVLGPQNISSEGTSQFCTPFFPVDDIIVEGTESFFVVMSPISDRVKPYQPGKDRIEVHIKDDDGKCEHFILLFCIMIKSPIFACVN